MASIDNGVHAASDEARLARIPFGELRTVLAALRDGVRSVLGENLAGVYVQGSFALGDGDAYSDLDFVVVTHADVDGAVEAELNAMHGRLHDRPETWAQHLEGSYAPAAVIRRPAGAADTPRFARPADWRDPAIGGSPPARGYPFLFLDNGGRMLARSEHDDTNVVRWVLREHGIALHGPQAAELIDPVEPGALVADVRHTAAAFADSLLSGETVLEPLHLQCFTVLFYCRVVLSLATGRIPSKPEAMRWALAEFGPRWAPLINDAWQRRAEYPRGRGAPARHAALHAPAAAIGETLAFVRFAYERMGPVDRRA